MGTEQALGVGYGQGDPVLPQSTRVTKSEHHWIIGLWTESGTYLCSPQETKLNICGINPVCLIEGNLFSSHAQMGVDKMTEGGVETGYTSLHRCIRTSKDSAVPIEDQVNTVQDFLTTTEENIRIHTGW